MRNRTRRSIFPKEYEKTTREREEQQGQRTQNEINTFDQIGESKTMVYRSGRSGLLSSLRS